MVAFLSTAGEPLTDRSRRPKTCASKTEEDSAEKVAGARKDTGYGPHRLSDYQRRTEGMELSPWTIRNILQRKEMTGVRNVLVHDYVELDRQRVYVILQDKLDELVAIKQKGTELL